MLVATLTGLKMHGGTELSKISEPDIYGVSRGLSNLDRHIKNLKSFGRTVVVWLNKFASDTETELDMVREHCQMNGVYFAINNVFMEGGEGAVDLANLVVAVIEKNPSGKLKFTYKDNIPIKDKIEHNILRLRNDRSDRRQHHPHARPPKSPTGPEDRCT